MKEKERLVLYLQDKNSREIAKEAKVSFRDIGRIKNKAEKESEAKDSETQKQWTWPLNWI